MILASLLSSSSYIITNKFLIKALGTDAAILIGELCSEYNYWEQKDELKDGEWFYSTRENIENNTGLSEHKQRVAINLLEKKKLIETKRIGIPCKTYYKLNEENILNIIKEEQKFFKSSKNSDVQKLDIKEAKILPSGNEENQQQGIENIDINNNNINNNKNNKEEHTRKESMNEEKNYNKKLTFNQREYPPGFFDFLYCNKELKLE